MRIKIPYGGVTPDQLDVIAELAEEYSDGDPARHHAAGRPAPLRPHRRHARPHAAPGRRSASPRARPAATASATSPPARSPASATPRRSTPRPTRTRSSASCSGHPDCQDFGRKFKPAFSGCAGEACGLVMMHDFGAIARKTVVDGVERRAFDLYVGGGLGTTPHQAKLLYEDHPVEELLPAVQSIARVFGRLGEKQNRNRARIKFLVSKLGIDEFRRLVDEERADPAARRALDVVPAERRRLRRVAGPRGRPGVDATAARCPRATTSGCATNVYRQRQPGYAVATVALPLGDITSEQTRAARPTSPASTSATPSARRSSRTSCCAGSPSTTCRRSTRS